MTDQLIVSFKSMRQAQVSILSVTTMSNRMGLEGICYLSSGSKESIYSINLARLATVWVFGGWRGRGAEKVYDRFPLGCLSRQASPCSVAWT